MEKLSIEKEQNLKTAIIGLGVIGKVHAQIVKAQGRNLVAVCDLDETKLEKYTDSLHYKDYLTMLDEVKPDVVHICTPHYLHAQMIIEGLKRNINVLCEKPICISYEEIEAVLEAEKNSSAILGVCHQNRYNLSNLFVKDYIKDKKVTGGFGAVVWKRDQSYYNAAPWRGKWETAGGGVLMNQALHTLDLMQWLLGMPNSVSANLSTQRLKGIIEVEDNAILNYFGKSNFNFFATTSGCCDFPVEIALYTGGEIIKIIGDQVVINGRTIQFEKSDKIYGKSCYGVGHENLIADFYNCVIAGEGFTIDAKEGCKVIRLILSAYKSNQQKIDIK
ncbi:MAG: Gfo/Idh/MocA family oxidoreductase [Clostridia bacterium]|nr:Gfo/Idh/MocA family oxidoreductase [Clostridia bacterium]